MQRVVQALAGACLLLGAFFATPAPALSHPAEGTPIASYREAVDSAQALMMASPREALDRARTAEAFIPALSSISDPATAQATVWWLQAEALHRLGRAEDAYPVASRALEALGDNPPNSKLHADILTALGRINKVLGGHGQALESYQSAYEIYREIDDPRSESLTLVGIASLYTDARQYERAIEYFRHALERYQDPAVGLSVNNNIGNALTQLERYDEAEAAFQEALAVARDMESTSLEARVLENLAIMQVEAGRYDAAEANIDLAFERVSDTPDLEWARFFWGVRARIAFARGDTGAAVRHIERIFEDRDLTTTTQAYISYHEFAAELYASQDEWRRVAQHLRAFKRLDDERAAFAASANTALINAQFDFAVQEMEIDRLRIEGLQRELALQNSRASQRVIVATAALALVLMLLIVAVVRQRSAKERANILARTLYEDSQTGLPSRAALERNLADLAAGSDGGGSVIALQLNRRKHLESVLGFTRFAEIQARMAERLCELDGIDTVYSISPGMLGILARSTAPETVLALARDCAERLTEPVRLADLDIDVSVRGGAGIGADPELCIRHATIAVHQAQQHRESAAVFDPEQYGDPSQNLTLMNRMLAATRSGDMSMHYQPKLNLRTGRFQSVEALCRWHDPQRGFIPPAAFIHQAEEMGHIRALTEWTIQRVIADQRRFTEAGHDICVATNISGALVCDTDFVKSALDIVRDASGQITFEITETAVMDDPELAIENLNRISEAGIRLSIDDYGSGLSSLAYLRSLPARELKLDRAFVQHVATSERDRMVVKSTVDLAHNLGLDLVAEGVEDEAGLAIVKLLGCDWAQGFGLSKPLPVPDAIVFLDKAQQSGAMDLPKPTFTPRQIGTI